MEQPAIKPKVAVIIPSYKVKDHIVSVISKVGPEVERIYVVDDACPVESGKFVQSNCQDDRVQVVFLAQNSGVGGATIAGFQQAVKDGFEILIKIDGDGQMNPQLIPEFVRPLALGQADYSKGNRFYDLESLNSMPPVRLFGNSVLSFVNKAASGYWNLMDPTNGYVAIHARVFERLPVAKLEKRFFFESDLLFRLNTIRAVIAEIPMDSVYADEKSNLRIKDAALRFPLKYLQRLFKRICYDYFLRDFNVASIELVSGMLLVAWGTAFGALHWLESFLSARPTTTGTVMLAVLPIMLGFQLLLAALHFDVTNIPTNPIHLRVSKRRG